MAITILDPSTALVLIDLQQGIVAYPTVHPVADTIKNANRLINGFRRHDLPVVLVNVDGGAGGRTEQPRSSDHRPPDWTELVAELDQAPDDLRITKHTWGAFSAADFHRQLRQLGVTQIVLAGIATSIGVESTARQAHELGYNVTLAVDAMTDMSADAHHNSVARIFPRLGETGSTVEILQCLSVGR